MLIGDHAAHASGTRARGRGVRLPPPRLFRPGANGNGRTDVTDRPERLDDEGGYYFDHAAHRRLAGPSEPEAATPETGAEPEESAPEPLERFKRATPARLKTIRPERPRGRWGLAVWTVLYVLLSASAAGYLSVGARLGGHALFWAAIAVALLVSVRRERGNGWEPASRWPWAVALIGGTLAVELIVAALSPLTVVIGSAVILSAGLLVLLMLG